MFKLGISAFVSVLLLTSHSCPIFWDAASQKKLRAEDLQQPWKLEFKTSVESMNLASMGDVKIDSPNGEFTLQFALIPSDDRGSSTLLFFDGELPENMLNSSFKGSAIYEKLLEVAKGKKALKGQVEPIIE